MSNNRFITKKQFREIIEGLADHYAYDISIIKVSSLFVEVHLGNSIVTGLFVSELYNATGCNFVIEQSNARMVLKFDKKYIKRD